jgi:hypothetical protein
MALYGGSRDVSFWKRINEELIIDLIDTEVLYYKLVLDETRGNLYGESDKKSYFDPVVMPALVNREEQNFAADDFGADYQINAKFAFLRDTLVERALYVEVGDVIQWDNEYYEVDGIIENQYLVGKNPSTWLGGDTATTSLSSATHT